MRTLPAALAATLLSFIVGAGLARAADTTVATVGTQVITEAQLEKLVKPKLIEVDNQRYDVLREGLEELVQDSLLEQEAKARGITPAELVQKEITDKVPPPTDAEIQELYDENKERLDGQTLEQAKPRIVAYLSHLGVQKRRTEFINSLKAKYKTVVKLQAPVVDVGTAGRPSRGGANAKVTIIEFSDYECPFCKRAEETVKEVLKAYPEQVRVVYRDFPLEDAHPQARPAAEAAHCAQAQGKFWEYHDKLFAQESLSTEKFKAIAVELKLDTDKFNQCIEKGQTKDAVQQDITDASSVGVTGTPTFFVNGRLISGARPYEDFKIVIDEELAKK